MAGCAGLDGRAALRALRGCTRLRRVCVAPAGAGAAAVAPVVRPAARPRAADVAALAAAAPRLAAVDTGGVPPARGADAAADALRGAAVAAVLEGARVAVAVGDALKKLVAGCAA